MTEQNNVTTRAFDTVLDKVSGLGDLLNTPISKVILNGQEVDVEPLKGIGYASGENGEVTPSDFLTHLDNENILEQEFVSEYSAQIVDGSLVISPQNVGSKG